jgi:hypothetical protein
MKLIKAIGILFSLFGLICSSIGIGLFGQTSVQAGTSLSQLDSSNWGYRQGFAIFDDFSYPDGSFTSNSNWTKYVGGTSYSGSDVLIDGAKLKLYVAGAGYAQNGEVGVCSVDTFSTSNPIVVKYTASAITKTFFDDWDQCGAWPGGFYLTTSSGYRSETGNNYLCVVDDYNGDFIFSALVGNIDKSVVIEIDSTNVKVTLNGVVEYNGAHYLSNVSRYIHFSRYADQRTWLVQKYDNISVERVSCHPKLGGIQIGLLSFGLVLMLLGIIVLVKGRAKMLVIGAASAVEKVKRMPMRTKGLIILVPGAIVVIIAVILIFI